MKQLTAVLVAGLALVGTSAMAQGDLPTQKGNKAIAFSINGLGDFNIGNAPVDSTGAIGATGIEGKYFFRDNVAVRLGLSLNRNSTTANNVETITTTFGIAPGIEYHFVSQDRFSLYTGGLLSYASREVETKPGVSVDNSGFGLAGLLGAEFYPWQNISFGAEYQAGFMTQDKPDTTNWGIASTGVVKLGFHW